MNLVIQLATRTAFNERVIIKIRFEIIAVLHQSSLLHPILIIIRFSEIFHFLLPSFSLSTFQLGFAPLNIATRKGHRSSSYIEYVKAYEGSRRNLTVIRYANVSEVRLCKRRPEPVTFFKRLYFRFCWMRIRKHMEFHTLDTEYHKLHMSKTK